MGLDDAIQQMIDRAVYKATRSLEERIDELEERDVSNKVLPTMKAAEALNVSAPTLYAYMKKGMPFSIVGGTRWIDIAEAQKWRKEQNK